MIKIVGHKGASGYATENTLSSFQMAINTGCDRAELDVHKTKDGQIVVFHDDNVSNLTNGSGFVCDLTLAELKALEYKHGGDIPTLQEVINVCKDKIDLQIELKSDGTPELVNNLILKNWIENQVVITSFRPNLLKEIKQINSDLIVGLLFGNAEEMNVIWNLIDTVPLDFLGPYSGLITKEFVDKAHSLGKPVYAYRVNDKELGDKLKKMGVDALGTDFPKLFKAL